MIGQGLFEEGTTIGSAASGGMKGVKKARWALVPLIGKRALIKDLPEEVHPFAISVLDFEEEPSRYRAAEMVGRGMDLLSKEGLQTDLAEVYGFGAAKYPDAPDGKLNFQKGYNFSWSIDALWRHLLADLNPLEMRDFQSNKPHVVHAVWHALALYEFLRTEVGVDDLPYASRSHTS